jgi:hypothetical protein
MSTRPVKCVILRAVLALLLLGNGLSAEWPGPPSGQPMQMQSQVDYDPKLSDPFFKSYERVCTDWSCKRRRFKTAKCFPSFNVSSIDFCDAKLLADDTIELFIYGDAHNLRMVVQNWEFRSQYWYNYIQYTPGDELLTWTTTKQTLTLDKKVYRKGDVIKSTIYFECAEGNNDPNRAEAYLKYPRIIKINGVFKTIVK